MYDYKRWIRLFFAAAALASCSVNSVLAAEEGCPSQSTSRFALVIGNSYAGARAVSGDLDAKVIAEHLCQLGFSVDLVIDALLEELTGNPARNEKGVIEEFAVKIANAKEVVFFFSGHGYQVGGKNYLLPNDEEIDFDDLQFPLNDVLTALKKAPQETPKIIFLDACRTLVNPPEGVEVEGLAESQDIPPQTLLSYAAEYGHIVRSGTGGRLSPYTDALAKSIREPGLGIFQLLARISKDVPRDQTPIYQFNKLPPFFFRPAVQLRMEVKSVNDQLLIFHNGKLAMAASREEVEGVEKKPIVDLELSAGNNELVLMMFNSRAFHHGQRWLVTDGWKYELDVGWPQDVQLDCKGRSPCFEDAEATPFKSGPHHGQLFEVARAQIYVDPAEASIQATVDPDVWKKQTPSWAQAQGLLWESSFEALRPLVEQTSISQLFDIYSFVKEIIGALEIAEAVDLPDLSNLWTQVYGNTALGVPVQFCMEQERAARLGELETSLKRLLEGTESRPFDIFDKGLSRCVQEWVQDHPEHSLFGQETKVWTALEERETSALELGQ